jgi:hypothetical protein
MKGFKRIDEGPIVTSGWSQQTLVEKSTGPSSTKQKMNRDMQIAKQQQSLLESENRKVHTPRRGIESGLWQGGFRASSIAQECLGLDGYYLR